MEITDTEIIRELEHVRFIIYIWKGEAITTEAV